MFILYNDKYLQDEKTVTLELGESQPKLSYFKAQFDTCIAIIVCPTKHSRLKY